MILDSDCRFFIPGEESLGCDGEIFSLAIGNLKPIRSEAGGFKIENARGSLLFSLRSR